MNRTVLWNLAWSALLAALALLMLLVVPARSRGEESLAPHPAWRYEEPRGHRAAVVRIYGQDDAKTRSIGSGTLVKWSGRIVVLTARHVVKDARQLLVELHHRRTHRARVVVTDKIWDCAVLELIDAPVGVEAAEVELGAAAMQSDGSRLESCGYGPDGKLACNSGLFIGYRRSTAAPDGPDDWMAISGHARGGDSGGGVFNQRGRLVGVLWGTDGKEVVCVQAGRIHALLNQAVAVRDEGRGMGGGGTDCKLQNGCGECPVSKQPLLPWREDVEKRDRSQSEQIDRLIALERLRAARESRPPVMATPSPEVRVPTPDNELSPLVAGLCILGAVAAGCVVYFAAPRN